MPEPFRVVYADPGWPEKAGSVTCPAPAASRGGAAAHYKNRRTMTMDEIKNFRLPPITDDAWLFLWTTQRHLHNGCAMTAMERWGFRDTGSEFVWVKMTEKFHGPEIVDPRHRLQAAFSPVRPVRPVFGMGYYARIGHETLLIGRRGRPRPLSHSLRSVVYAPRGKHSEKPEIFASIIEAFSEGPYVELFARRRRPGWTSLGNQLETK